MVSFAVYEAIGRRPSPPSIIIVVEVEGGVGSRKWEAVGSGVL